MARQWISWRGHAMATPPDDPRSGPPAARLQAPMSEGYAPPAVAWEEPFDAIAAATCLHSDPLNDCGPQLTS
jgi:hypothetical protein